MHFLIEWNKRHEDIFSSLGIRTVSIQDHSTASTPKGFIDHETQEKIGRVTLFDGRHLEAEVFEVSTGIRILFAYYLQPKKEEVDILLSAYLEYLR